MILILLRAVAKKFLILMVRYVNAFLIQLLSDIDALTI